MEDNDMETDRIMAGQNHKMLHGMILSCHDSVFFHLVAAVPRCALRVSAVHLGVLQSHAYG
jgi:hypothetical protein